MTTKPSPGSSIMITGVSGQIGLPLAASLARDHHVIGVARFADQSVRERVEALGIETIACDLTTGDFSALPADVDHVVHLAAFQGMADDADTALRHNAEATGLLLQHCRSARSALVMSTFSVYRMHDDPWHAFAESDPLGGVSPHSPAYSASKLGQEAVARTCARLFDLPVTLARMNVSWGVNGGLIAYHLDTIRSGGTVRCRWDPNPYSPIHQDDIDAQLLPLLGAASVPATIVNWCGDDVVTVQEWCAEAAAIVGRSYDSLDEVVVAAEVPGATRGGVGDTTLRRSITGPCQVDWRAALRDVAASRP